MLRAAGPEIADGPDALGPLAIRIVDEGLRPFITRWHTELRKHEETSAGESAWPRRAEFDGELRRVRAEPGIYLENLATLAGIRAWAAPAASSLNSWFAAGEANYRMINIEFICSKPPQGPQ